MSEWISVKDKLPEKSDHNDYLITDGEHFYVGHYRYKAKAWDHSILGWIQGMYADTGETYDVNITHWMPLPNPPGKGSEMIKHCIIFATTKARAHFIFCNLLEVMLDEGIQIVKLKGNPDVALFSSGEEWRTCVANENCRGIHWDRAFVDSEIPLVEIETYVEPAKNPYAEDYRKLYLPDEKGYRSILKEKFINGNN